MAGSRLEDQKPDLQKKASYIHPGHASIYQGEN
jgi:hypothetical protein